MNKFQIYRGVKHPFKNIVKAALAVQGVDLYEKVAKKQLIPTIEQSLVLVEKYKVPLKNYILAEADAAGFKVWYYIKNQYLDPQQVVEYLWLGDSYYPHPCHDLTSYMVNEVVATLNLAVENAKLEEEIKNRRKRK